MDTYPPENSQEKKKYNLWENLSKKIISTMVLILKLIFVLWEKFYIEEEHTNTKQTKNKLLDK